MRLPGGSAAATLNGPRGFVIVFNRHAGGGRSFEILRSLRTALDDRHAEIVETTADAGFAARLRERVRDLSTDGGRPVVVVVGGDGSLSMALNALRRPEDAVFAVIPAGSGNDFAAALGIDGPRAAIEALETGAPRAIDLGIVNGTRFANCVGLGLDAEVGRLSSAFRARGYPPKPSYYAAALVGLFRVRPVGLTIETPSLRRRFEDGVMVTIGNGSLYGGGFRGAPGALLDDGLLDAYAFSDVRGVFRRFALMQRIKAGAHVADPNVTAFRTPSIVVSFDRDVAMHVDGETSMTRRAEIGLLPRAWSAIAPRSAES